MYLTFVMMKYSSLPQMVRDRFAEPMSGSLFSRGHKTWEECAPAQFIDDLRSISAVFKDMGLSGSRGTGIIAPSCPEWMVADLAVQVCHSYTVPMFPNLSLDAFRYQCEDAAVETLIVKNPTQLDPSLRKMLEGFKHVIILSPTEPLASNESSWKDLLERGRHLRKDIGDSWFDQQIDGIQEDEIATVIYTSGSTGVPKGSMITHANLLFQFDSASQLYPIDPLKDKCLSILPVAHVFERMVVYFFMYCRIPIYFADDPKNVGIYLKELRPTVISMVPRILERLYEKLVSSPWNTHGPKRWLMQWAIRHAKYSDPRYQSALHRVFDRLVYSKMREALGNSLTLVISGSSALNIAVHRFLLNIGLPIYEGYGLTECSPVLSAEHSGAMRLGSVGRAFPGVRLRIGPQNEVQAKSPGCMKGYHNHPETTSASFTEDGWFRTGDYGYLDEDGYLFIKGRIKEQFKTSTGKYVSPLPIEQAIARHPLIDVAVVIADNRKFACALIFLDHSQVGQALRKTEYDPVKGSQSRRVNARIARQIQRVNRGLNDWEKIRKWVIVPDPITPESGLLTPTLKIRRHTIEKKYQLQLENIYLGQTE
jgi:long-chain acyl-CoA synthetase